jgi:hypothetical protein
MKVTNFKFSSIPSALSFACLILCSLPAVADVYPIKGVWAAANPEFPIAENEACFTIKTFGLEAVARKSIAEIIIFTDEKRYDAKGDMQTRSEVQSVKAADGGYWITELPNVRRRSGFRYKLTYFLAIIDPTTIDIRDNSRSTRFVKCGRPERGSF